MAEAVIRPGGPGDLAGINRIYNHYVGASDALFDEEPRSMDAAAEWMARYRPDGPHRLLVAVTPGDGREGVRGFAASHPYRSHPAFRECVETSIMLAPEACGGGLGTRLYEALFACLRDAPVHRAYAGVALPNPASCALHEKMGFRQIGIFDQYALKHGRRISSVWYEKAMDARG